MKIVRAIIGTLILFIDGLTAPNPPKRAKEAQAQLDSRTENLVLFEMNACPFCVKVRRQIRRQGLKIRSKDIRKDPQAAAELLAGGKLDQVPCLRIDRPSGTEWLYESDAINAFLKSEFAETA